MTLSFSLFIVSKVSRRRVEQLAARRAHNPEAVGSSPTPAKVVSGLSSEQKPPADVVSRPEKKLGNPFCGAKAPEWVAIVFALVSASPEVFCKESVHCKELKSSHKHKEGEYPQGPIGIDGEGEIHADSSQAYADVAKSKDT